GGSRASGGSWTAGSDMASDAGEVQTGSAMMVTTNQAEKRQAEEEPENLCTICLSEIVNAASVEECFHTFCFKCIQQWAAKRPVCPLCMQSFNHILLSVNADQYQVYTVGSSAREQRTMAVHSILKMCRCGASGHGLLDLIVLKVFSNLNNSMNL
uniref:RING-type E3 ubiquitin transferase n=1 Tax=Falco tinnunculus TaxID=100819 RepID=A0A8C4XTZ2_FALTI